MRDKADHEHTLCREKAGVGQCWLGEEAFQGRGGLHGFPAANYVCFLVRGICQYTE